MYVNMWIKLTQENVTYQMVEEVVTYSNST